MIYPKLITFSIIDDLNYNIFKSKFLSSDELNNILNYSALNYNIFKSNI